MCVKIQGSRLAYHRFVLCSVPKIYVGDRRRQKCEGRVDGWHLLQFWRCNMLCFKTMHMGGTCREQAPASPVYAWHDALGAVHMAGATVLELCCVAVHRF